jgi:hypothetical protein
MSFLRTVSTRRLLAMITGLVLAAGGGTAIAVAAVGAGPVPRPKPLAQAIRSALAAKAPIGLSADVSFTNNLISSADLQGTDPLLSGASGRLWVTARHLRLELQSDSGQDAQLVAGPHSFWAYDPASNTVYEGSFGSGARRSADKAGSDKLPSIARIQSVLARLSAHLGISGAAPTDVGGRPAYRVAVSPKSSGGLIGKLQLAWDAVRGVPLDFAVYARGDSSPVLELKATSVSYGPVSGSVFALTPPAGAKVVKLSMPAGARRQATRTGRAKQAGKAAPQLNFTPVRPGSLAGRTRQSSRVIGWSGHPAELTSYGKGLGAIVVIERRAGAGSALPATASSGGENPGLALPTVTIGTARGVELDTALGSVLEFTRGGVAYVVAGSVPPRALRAAAGAL